MHGMRVLVVEDEPKLASLLARGLGEEGHPTDVATTGHDAVWMARANPYDVIMLDVMLPGQDGFEVCRELRARDVWTPVLFLTARDSVADRVGGLDVGGDDYLVKPFSFPELLARLRALTRRGPVERPTVLQVGSLRLDPAEHRVWRDGAEIELSTKEFELLERGWDMAYETRSNVVDVYVRYLREKIDRPFGCDSLETVRGVGYRLRVSPSC